MDELIEVSSSRVSVIINDLDIPEVWIDGERIRWIKSVDYKWRTNTSNGLGYRMIEIAYGSTNKITGEKFIEKISLEVPM